MTTTDPSAKTAAPEPSREPGFYWAKLILGDDWVPVDFCYETMRDRWMVADGSAFYELNEVSKWGPRIDPPDATPGQDVAELQTVHTKTLTDATDCIIRLENANTALREQLAAVTRERDEACEEARLDRGRLSSAEGRIARALPLLSEAEGCAGTLNVSALSVLTRKAIAILKETP
jgi:hypothetical protein